MISPKKTFWVKKLDYIATSVLLWIEYTYILFYMDKRLQFKKITNVGKDMEKLKPLSTDAGTVKRQNQSTAIPPWTCPILSKMVEPLWKTVWQFLEKLKIELPYDPAIALLSIHSKEFKAGSRRDISIPMVIAALFTIAKMWKQSKCPSTDEWISKMWFTLTMEYYSVLKRKEIPTHATTSMNPEDIN